MRSYYLLIGLCTLQGLCACQPAKEEPPADPPKPVSETVFGPTVSALDKARSVEGTLQQDKNSTDAAINGAE